jgi:hypothetical protein
MKKNDHLPNCNENQYTYKINRIKEMKRNIMEAVYIKNIIKSKNN